MRETHSGILRNRAGSGGGSGLGGADVACTASFRGESGFVPREVPGADRVAYGRTMRRLRELPVEVVHAGHDPSFGRERLVELCDAYLSVREG